MKRALSNHKHILLDTDSLITFFNNEQSERKYCHSFRCERTLQFCLRPYTAEVITQFFGRLLCELCYILCCTSGDIRLLITRLHVYIWYLYIIYFSRVFSIVRYWCDTIVKALCIAKRGTNKKRVCTRVFNAHEYRHLPGPEEESHEGHILRICTGKNSAHRFITAPGFYSCTLAYHIAPLLSTEEKSN